MIIKPCIGFDHIKFGMTELEIITLLGKPDFVTVDEADEDENRVYQYNNLKTRLTFYSTENNRLAYLRTTNSNVIINDKPIIDCLLNEAILGLNTSKKEWEEELYFSFNAYFNEKWWLTLHEEYGRITNIEMGISFVDDSDNIYWPE